MVILLDLDGTLVDTAYEKYKPYKDGIKEVEADNIPLMPGAKEFVNKLKYENHEPIIVSDSHYKYVEKISKQVFDCECVSLVDKPNIQRVKKFFLDKRHKIGASYPDIDSDKQQFIVIGDTWLDVEMGRALNVQTILTDFYKATQEENRDGIGQMRKHLKSGPTYCVNKFEEIFAILELPLTNLLSLEAVFQNVNSVKSIKFHTAKTLDRFVAYRILGRQQAGECDKYAVADKYFEFQREDRLKETLEKIAAAVSVFLISVQENMPNIKWDYFTYVSDKKTTKPQNKLSELFYFVKTNICKEEIICWGEEIDGSIKNQKNYGSRKDFVGKNVFLKKEPSLKDKNIIILDDQLTTGGTADSICEKLINEKAKNILFVSLFFLVNTVESERACPQCGTKLQIKVNRTSGSRFISCVSPRYGGKGCGNFIQNLS